MRHYMAERRDSNPRYGYVQRETMDQAKKGPADGELDRAKGGLTLLSRAIGESRGGHWEAAPAGLGFNSGSVGSASDLLNPAR